MNYTVVKGSVLMPKNKLARVGTVLTADQFKGYEKNLQTLLAAGVLKQGKLNVEPGVAADRGVGDFAPLPLESEDGKSRTLTSKTKNLGVKAKVEAIKAAQKNKPARQQKLAEFEGDEMTLAEAQANGLV